MLLILDKFKSESHIPFSERAPISGKVAGFENNMIIWKSQKGQGVIVTGKYNAHTNTPSH